MRDERSDHGQEIPRGDPRVALIEAGVLLASELSLPVILRRLVEIAVSITGARYGALGVTGPNGGVAQFITVGLGSEERAAIGALPQGRGILGALIRDPRPLRLARLQDDPRSVGFPAHHPKMTSFLGAPVRARGKVFGNLYLTNKVGGEPFDADDEGAAVTLATQAGVAIANAQTFGELIQRERWLGALHAVTAALVAGQPQHGLLTTIVRSAKELAGADLAAIALPVDEGSPALKVFAAEGVGSEQLLRAPPKSAGTASHLVLRTGRSQTLRSRSGELGGTLLAGAGVPLGVLMVVPLGIGGRVDGTISLALLEPEAEFRPDAEAQLESFAAQASIALDYARVQAQLLHLAVVDERHRIARDLHDEPVQALIYLARRLEFMASESSAEGTSSTKLEETREVAVAVADGLRQLTEGLRSDILDHAGLPAALLDLVQRFSSRAEVAADFSTRGALGRWNQELERDLFRVAQEALSNVERHAQASEVRVDLIARPGSLTLRVGDNGIGFISAGNEAVSRGLGTLGMRERVAGHGGRLMIRSRSGRGTIVAAVVPSSPIPGNGGDPRAQHP
ncbi:MAG TPA: GAF domain-containing sensor histidine kinase [Candidatus Micrarchaeaceae archaeon]|nr:GAF domain-containing sensor histidine kinase [Candidatus Micrarchaeaceae archaeon]